jgi:diguanylate cyclase (GGDEF)-like protein
MKTEAQHETSDLIHLSFFTEIGTAIASARTVREVLERVMEHVGKIFAPRNWSLLLVDQKRKELVFTVVVGKAADKLRGKRIPIEEGVTGWIARTGQTVIIEDPRKDSRFNPKIDEATGFVTESIIGVPLRSGKRIFGVIELINKINGEPFTPFDLQVLSTIADFAAVAIEKAFYINAIKRISREDPLTGLLNRRSMDAVLERETERSRRYRSVTSVLLIDVDDFKKINDTHGHLAGDEVLKRCADILRNSVRKIDYVIRFGGDEFVVIMPDTSSENGERARDRILKAIAEDCAKPGACPFTVSIGLHTGESADLYDILNLTDRDLYRRKEAKEPLKLDESLLDCLDDCQAENGSF